MKPTFRKSMIWLHTYAGLLGGWLMFAVFLTGTLSYYNTEITHWISGNSPVKITPKTQQQQVLAAQSWLQDHSPNASRWQIELPSERGHPFRLRYQDNDQMHNVFLDPYTLQPYQRVDTNGGNFFRTFHYTLSLRNWGGRYLTGIAAMLMLVGIFSGIYTHRRFFKDFFTLRTRQWSGFLKDLHGLFGIVCIPFCFVICVSALLIYINRYIPFTIYHYYDSTRALDREVSTRYPTVILKKGNDQPAQAYNSQTAPQKIWPILVQHWGEKSHIKSITVDAPQTPDARWVVNRHHHENLSNKSDSLAFDGQGQLLAPLEKERLARQVRRVFYGLHEAHFAQPALRFILFSLGMISSLLIATGMVIWLQKHREKRPRAIHYWTAKINLAALYGLSLSVALYLLMSRLPGISGSISTLEIQSFFYTWLASLILCLVLKEKRAKYILLLANFFAFLSLLLLDIFGEKGHLLNAWFHWDWPYLSINLILTATVIAFFVATDKVSQEPEYD